MIDISPEQLERNAEAAEKLLGDLETFDFGDRRFDIGVRLPEPLRNAVLETSARTLAPTGTFRQLTVMPWIYYRMYARYFDDVRFRFCPWNLPPGGVYVCRGFRPASVAVTK